MKKFNKIEISLLQDLSEELSIDISFLEKDYYVTQMLCLLSFIKDTNFKLIFSGGTCLSKAYMVTKRFSEDIDLRIQENNISSREERKAFVNKIIDSINETKNFKIVSIKKEDTSHRIILNIKYEHIIENNQFLRPEIKLELLFSSVKLKTENKQILSIADEYTKQLINVFEISCINIIELSAEKYSALLWRTLYSNNKDYDPTLIRHLYDLAMLKQLIFSSKDLFKKTLVDIYNQDKIKRDKNNKFNDIVNSSNQFYNLLKTENKFSVFYKNFVQNMCYDLSYNNFTFEQALENFKEISNVL